jgi:UrcA family protein
MNAMTTSTSLRGLIVTALFGTVALSFASISTASDSTGAREVTVQYADLNVSISRGAVALYGRIRAAAEGVCSPLYHGDLSSKMHRDTCVQQSIADAVTKVNQGALFAVYNAKNSRPLPVIVASDQPR